MWIHLTYREQLLLYAAEVHNALVSNVHHDLYLK